MLTFSQINNTTRIAVTHRDQQCVVCDFAAFDVDRRFDESTF